jgi:aminopeptidase-like protein
MEDIREFEINNLRKQVNNLKEMWNLINEELEVYNIVIGMSMTDEEFYERKKEAWKIYVVQKEEEENE